jgi:hypothetical protein
MGPAPEGTFLVAERPSKPGHHKRDGERRAGGGSSFLADRKDSSSLYKRRILKNPPTAGTRAKEHEVSGPVEGG